jgi:hypothetical protein
VIRSRRSMPFLALTALFMVGIGGASAQQPLYEGVTAHNSSMSALQPSWIVPLVEADPRLVQVVRASFSNEYTAARAETVNYGDGRGITYILSDRFEFDYLVPPYIQHNVATSIDGLGDTSVLGKVRIASGDAGHGNYALGALLGHTFATGTYKNGAATDCWAPTLAGGRAFGRFDVQSSLGGSLPTGRITAQGRSIGWNALMQARGTRSVWFEMENNATFYFAGSHDGKMQNFITPAAFYVMRRKGWEAAHPFLIFDGGMQIATSNLHTYNHNLISEARLLF